MNNLPELKTFRKELRSNMTPAEAALWGHLKGSKLEGRKFRRQHSVERYILDFYCPSEKLAIELDGDQHNRHSQYEYDRERDIFLKMTGIKVIRFENELVFHHTDEVLRAIRSEFGRIETDTQK